MVNVPRGRCGLSSDSLSHGPLEDFSRYRDGTLSFGKQMQFQQARARNAALFHIRDDGQANPELVGHFRCPSESLDDLCWSHATHTSRMVKPCQATL